MDDTQCAEVPLSNHVDRFWKHLDTETVRILVDLKRVVGEDAPDGPVVYWDSASFSDDVAKALVADHKRLVAALRKIAVGTADAEYPFRAVPAEYLRRWASDALNGN